MYVADVLADLRKLAIDLLSVALFIWIWAFHARTKLRYSKPGCKRNTIGEHDMYVI